MELRLNNEWRFFHPGKHKNLTPEEGMACRNILYCTVVYKIKRPGHENLYHLSENSLIFKQILATNS